MSAPNGNPNTCNEHYYNASQAQTKSTVVAHKANCYGFEVENNGAADVFLQVFDALAADVTVGTTVPNYTFRIPASSNFGKDSQDLALHYHGIGIVIAVTSTRTGSSAPAAAATVNIWYTQGA